MKKVTAALEGAETFANAFDVGEADANRVLAVIYFLLTRE